MQNLIETYSLEEGIYPYLLNNDYQNYNGVTEDLYYKGEILLKANPNGNKASHCTGITFEVFFKAMEKRNKSLGIPSHDFNGHAVIFKNWIREGNRIIGLIPLV